MTEGENILEQIDRYLEGSMGGEERISFEHLLSTDAELAGLVEAAQLAEQVVIGHEILKLKEQMSRDLSGPKEGNGKYWLGLLVVAIMGMGAYFLNNATQEKKPTPVKERNIVMEKANTAPIQTGLLPQKTEQRKPLAIPSEKNTASDVPIIPARAVVQEPNSNIVSVPVASFSQQEEKKADVLLPATVKNLCEGLKIDFDFYTLPTCKGESIGEAHVKLETIKGGIPPYKFLLSYRNNFGVGIITGLPEGTYQLFVKDANDCVVAHSRSVVIGGRACNEPKEFSFNPTYDPAWPIPYDANKKPRHIKILDKSGREVYQSDVSDVYPKEWNGESNTGLVIGIGYHLYFIEYADGTTDKGAITILR